MGVSVVSGAGGRWPAILNTRSGDTFRAPATLTQKSQVGGLIPDNTSDTVVCEVPASFAMPRNDSPCWFISLFSQRTSVSLISTIVH